MLSTTHNEFDWIRFSEITFLSPNNTRTGLKHRNFFFLQLAKTALNISCVTDP